MSVRDNPESQSWNAVVGLARLDVVEAFAER